jgi:hypothetical protein
VNGSDEIAADGAANAAIVHFKQFFVGAGDQFIVDPDLAEFVDNDRVASAMIFRKNAVQ